MFKSHLNIYNTHAIHHEHMTIHTYRYAQNPQTYTLIQTLSTRDNTQEHTHTHTHTNTNTHTQTHTHTPNTHTHTNRHRTGVRVRR